MSDSADNKIVLKLEIHVPICGGPPIVHQSQWSPPAVPSGHESVPERDCPQGTALVKVVGSNTGGVICATNSHDQDPTGRVPSDVRLMCFPGFVNEPSQPPPGAAQAAPDGPPDKPFIAWHHYALGGAQCGLPSTGMSLPWNTLAIWRKYSDGSWTPSFIRFTGQCSDKTDCEAYRGVQRSEVSAQVLDTAPQAWRTEVNGFSGEMEALNGVWVLSRYPQPAEGYIAWICGGDGMREPRLELFGRTCGCEPLELRLSCGGKRIVYQARRDEFNPLGANRFTPSRDQDVPAGCLFPDQLQLVPA